VVAQIPYYFSAAVALGSPSREVTFVVPTGNFGDILAGYAAARMGLPVKTLVIATNTNDILARTLETGRYELGAVSPTISPSMDIQVSSNFERLLFEALGRDGAGLQRLMDGLAQSGGFTIPAAGLESIRRLFAAGRASEAETAGAIKSTWDAAGYLPDPHTAVGISVAQSHIGRKAPVVTLATAHPAKFPAAVKAAAGIEPPLPVWLADLNKRPERFDVLGSDQGEVESYILARART
jgi:threonine synthase